MKIIEVVSTQERYEETVNKIASSVYIDPEAEGFNFNNREACELRWINGMPMIAIDNKITAMADGVFFFCEKNDAYSIQDAFSAAKFLTEITDDGELVILYFC